MAAKPKQSSGQSPIAATGSSGAPPAGKAKKKKQKKTSRGK
jgi:hypothetical protein